jgi:branched-chain amino acid transport system permease protein
VEGPIVGTLLFFVLRQTLAELGSIYLMTLDAIVILVMLFAPKGLWCVLADRFGWQAFPLARRVQAP